MVRVNVRNVDRNWWLIYGLWISSREGPLRLAAEMFLFESVLWASAFTLCHDVEYPSLVSKVFFGLRP